MVYRTNNAVSYSRYMRCGFVELCVEGQSRCGGIAVYEGGCGVGFVVGAVRFAVAGGTESYPRKFSHHVIATGGSAAISGDSHTMTALQKALPFP